MWNKGSHIHKLQPSIPTLCFVFFLNSFKSVENADMDSDNPPWISNVAMSCNGDWSFKNKVKRKVDTKIECREGINCIKNDTRNSILPTFLDVLLKIYSIYKTVRQVIPFYNDTWVTKLIVIFLTLSAIFLPYWISRLWYSVL